MINSLVFAFILSASPIVSRDCSIKSDSELTSVGLIALDTTEDTTTSIAHAKQLNADIVAYMNGKVIFLAEVKSRKPYEVDYIKESARLKFSKKWK